MKKVKRPKKPTLTASKRTWSKYEERLDDYVDSENEKKRRKEVTEKKLSKIKN